MSIAADFPTYAFRPVHTDKWIESGYPDGVEVFATVTYGVRASLLTSPDEFKKSWDEVNRYVIGLQIGETQDVRVFYMGMNTQFGTELDYFRLVEDTSPENGGAALTTLFGPQAGTVWKAFVAPITNPPTRRHISHGPSTVSWKVKVQVRPATSVQHFHFVGRFLNREDGTPVGWAFNQYMDSGWTIPVFRQASV
jgi:hypothetical protein